jgi:hypothetical protein
MAPLTADWSSTSFEQASTQIEKPALANAVWACTREDWSYLNPQINANNNWNAESLDQTKLPFATANDPRSFLDSSSFSHSEESTRSLKKSLGSRSVSSRSSSESVGQSSDSGSPMESPVGTPFGSPIDCPFGSPVGRFEQQQSISDNRGKQHKEGKLGKASATQPTKSKKSGEEFEDLQKATDGQVVAKKLKQISKQWTTGREPVGQVQRKVKCLCEKVVEVTPSLTTSDVCRTVDALAELSSRDSVFRNCLASSQDMFNALAMHACKP